MSKSSVTGPGTGKTKLDKERIKLCQKQIVSDSWFLVFYFKVAIFISKGFINENWSIIQKVFEREEILLDLVHIIYLCSFSNSYS